MNSKLKSATLVLIILIICSCKKDKRISNDIDNSSYRMESLIIDGQIENSLTTLEFLECKIYKELCYGSWKNDNGGLSQFYWQINEKGKEFVISNISTLENIPPNYPNYSAIEDCYNLSGKYTIIDKEKDNGKLILHLQSLSTEGYSGKMVEFILRQL